jgi:hypothetical protein
MPTSFFVLARFSLRVDNVLFRLLDTRIYHSFSSSPPLIVRETSGWEIEYQTLQAVRFYLFPLLAQRIVDPMCFSSVPPDTGPDASDTARFCLPGDGFASEDKDAGSGQARRDWVAGSRNKGGNPRTFAFFRMTTTAIVKSLHSDYISMVHSIRYTRFNCNDTRKLHSSHCTERNREQYFQNRDTGGWWCACCAVYKYGRDAHRIAAGWHSKQTLKKGPWSK